MIERQEKLCIPVSGLIGYAAPKERLLFFDIETTGLRAGSSSLYLIGILSYEEDSWQLTQYFSENLLEEQELLLRFSEAVDRKRKYGHPVLVTYNGDGFDIGYLKETAREYHLPSPFRDTLSFDLFKEIKPFKKLTGLPNLKLKTVEKLLGIDREDRYSGGELIAVYEEYLRLSGILPGGSEDTEGNRLLREKCLSCLLLHNAEDIENLPALMDLLSYRMLSEGKMTFQEALVSESPGKPEEKILDIRYKLDVPLPKEFSYEDENFVISVSGKDRLLFEAVIRLCEGELRYYYQDYKNYYYLPAEDMAIHKSLGEFVDRKNRKQATASTCYGKKAGLFVPEPSPVLTPVFYKSYKGMRYGELTEAFLSDEKKMTEFLLALLDNV